MAGINKVILIGNLGRDPELRYTQGGTAVCNLNIATTRSYTKGGQGGERVEETEWHRVTVWGKDGENASKYLAKGRQVYIEGRLQTRSYEDKNGEKRYQTEVVAETVQYLGGRDGGAERAGADDMDQSNWGGPPNGGKRSGGGRGGGGGRGRSGGRRAADDSGDQGGFDNYVPDAVADDIPF